MRTRREGGGRRGKANHQPQGHSRHVARDRPAQTDDARSARIRTPQGAASRHRSTERAIKDAREGVRSAPEAEVRDFILRAPIPEPVWNPRLYLPDDSFLAEPDGLIVESMVAIEVDSREHHSVGNDWDDTIDRHTELTSAGLLVVHIVPTRFRTNPRVYVERIIRTHEQGLRRTLPDIRVEPKDS